MSLFNAIDISSSGMTAQRLRMDSISENIANVNTTRTPSGTPYRRKVVVFESREPQSFTGALDRAVGQKQVGGGVRVVKIAEDSSPFKMVYDPTNPDANAQGYVAMPNVNIVSEMVNMISATRAYEANVTAVKSSKDIALKALEIGR